jgi:hypothetical protein
VCIVLAEGSSSNVLTHLWKPIRQALAICLSLQQNSQHEFGRQHTSATVATAAAAGATVADVSVSVPEQSRQPGLKQMLACTGPSWCQQPSAVVALQIFSACSSRAGSSSRRFGCLRHGVNSIAAKLATIDGGCCLVTGLVREGRHLAVATLEP